jgi:glutathione peroxidase
MIHNGRLHAGRTLASTLVALAFVGCSAAADQEPRTVGEKTQQVVDAVKANRQLAAQPAPQGGWPADSAYAFEFDGLLGGKVPLSAFRGEVVLVVNTASECGFTPQYEGLQALYSELGGRGLVVVGVPSNDFGGQEPGGAADIAKFCELNYGVTFPMTAKYAVKGQDAHPFYGWAEAQLGSGARPKWNFHKILIGRDGKPVAAFASMDGPKSKKLREAVLAALG